VSTALTDFESLRAEAARAAATNVVVFNVSQRTQIEITGSDRARFLHGFTSNDIKALKPGQGCETFITNLKGKVVAHVFVFCTETSLWLDGTPGQEAAILGHLGKYVLIDDVQLNPLDGERGELLVSGTLSTDLLQWDGGSTIGSNLTRESSREPLDIRKVDLFGPAAYLLSMPKDRLQTVKSGLCSLGVPEGSPALLEAMRIQAGFPQFGTDISDDNLAQEVGRTRQCVSFTKGCYLGQETIARLDSIGHTNRELRKFRFHVASIPPAGTIIQSADGDEDLGILTSSAFDPTNTEDVTVVSLGMHKRSARTIGTEVRIVLGDHKVIGQVC